MCNGFPCASKLKWHGTSTSSVQLLKKTALSYCVGPMAAWTRRTAKLSSKPWPIPGGSRRMAERANGILLDTSVVVAHLRGGIDVRALAARDEPLFVPL